MGWAGEIPPIGGIGSRDGSPIGGQAPIGGIGPRDGPSIGGRAPTGCGLARFRRSAESRVTGWSADRRAGTDVLLRTGRAGQIPPIGGITGHGMVRRSADGHRRVVG